ncbi:hypothetical protein C0U44_32200, partial [Klebsiella pneumoniae]
MLQQAVRVRAQRLVTHLLILQGIQRHIELQYIRWRGGGVLQQAVRVRAQRLVTHLLILQGIQRHIE